MSPSHQKGLSRLEILLIIFIALTIWFIFKPTVLHPLSHGAAKVEALNNAKAIAGGLVAFKTEYGSYPSAFTRAALEKEGFTNLPKGNDANAYLAQLVVTEWMDNEEVFYAPGMKGAFKGDNLINSPEKVLAPGENAFAYVMTTKGQPLTDVTDKTPLVLAHLKSSGPIPTFDPAPFGGEGVAGLADGSSAIFTINDQGHAISEDGKHLFATGADSLFGKETPVVVTPTKP